MKKYFIKRNDFISIIKSAHDAFEVKGEENQDYYYGYRQALRDVMQIVGDDTRSICVSGYEALVLDIKNDL